MNGHLLNNQQISKLKNLFNIFINKSRLISTNTLNNDSNNTLIADQKVRVRFAPSPTGKLHIGGLRTAFYNYLFARKYNGKFLLRIEDTDRERFQKDSLENIITSLKWAGIEPDFGPHHVNNKDNIENGGPWLQSLRLDLYNKYAEILLANNKAYRCFCDEARLVLLRRNAAKRQEKISYDGKCRHLSESTIRKNLSEGQKSVIRFKLEDQDIIYDDLTTGKHSSNPGKQEGDFIIMKSDGFPTYHFANVVDDHLMGITHVLRGQEWQLSTAKHISIYRAFGWNYPKYAHLPLICNKDGSKISKRQNDIDVLSYKNAGYMPESLLVYLSSIGGGLKKNLAENDFVFENFKNILNELVELFDENKISSRSIKLNQELLDYLNKKFIQLKLKSENRLELVNELRNLVEHKSSQTNQKFSLNQQYLSQEYLLSVLNWSQDRITKLNDLVENANFSFLWSDMSNFSLNELTDQQKLEMISLIDSLTNLLSKADSELFKNNDKLKKELNTTFENLKKVNQTTKIDNKVKSYNYWQLGRLILIGNLQGPPVVEIISLLGQENILFRLNIAKNYLIKNLK